MAIVQMTVITSNKPYSIWLSGKDQREWHFKELTIEMTGFKWYPTTILVWTAANYVVRPPYAWGVADRLGRQVEIRSVPIVKGRHQHQTIQTLEVLFADQHQACVHTCFGHISLFLQVLSVYTFNYSFPPVLQLDYIKLSWGGAEKQVMERLKGNLNANKTGKTRCSRW